MPKQRYVGKGVFFGYGHQLFVQSVTSTATQLNNYGVVSFGSTAAKTWRVRDPQKGQTVVLHCDDAAGQALQTVKTVSTNNITTPAGTLTSLVFSADDQRVTLIGLSTSEYMLVNDQRFAVADAASTATVFPNFGLTSFGATAAKSWKLAAPQPGNEVVLYCDDAATGAIQKVFASTSNSINFVTTGGSKNVAQFNKDNEVLFLRAQSATKWIVSPNASVAYSTA